MSTTTKHLNIYKIAIPLSWKRNLLYLLIAAVPCYLVYIFSGEYLRFLQEGILWIPFFVIYLYLRYSHNKKDFPTSLSIEITDEKIKIPAIRFINDKKTVFKLDDIDKILFYNTISRSGKPLLSYCEIIPKTGKRIRFSIFQLDLYGFKKVLSNTNIKVFSKKDERLTNTRYLMVFIILVFLLIFLFFIIPQETRDYLFDYILSGEVMRDYFSRWIK